MGRKEFLKCYNEQRQQCEIWCRCMGYYRNVSNFNKGKQSEFKERKFFSVKNQGGE